MDENKNHDDVNESKYSYILNGTLYFIILRDDEVERFRCRYGLSLTKVD